VRKWSENNDTADQQHACEWPNDFITVTMITTETKTKATKCSDHRTVSLTAHTAKIIARIFRRSIEKKTKDALGEDQFGFRRGKGPMDATGMLRIISEFGNR
jgi:hypothetical protein